MGFVLPNEQQGDVSQQQQQQQQQQQDPSAWQQQNVVPQQQDNNVYSGAYQGNQYNPPSQGYQFNPPSQGYQYNPADYGENPQITYADGKPILINGRELTAIERIDLADGVLDGKYFGAPIVGVEEESGNNDPNVTTSVVTGTAAPYDLPVPPLPPSQQPQQQLQQPIAYTPSAFTTTPEYASYYCHPQLPTTYLPPQPTPVALKEAYAYPATTNFPPTPVTTTYPAFAQQDSYSRGWLPSYQSTPKPYAEVLLNQPSQRYINTSSSEWQRHTIQPKPGTSIQITTPSEPPFRGPSMGRYTSSYF